MSDLVWYVLGYLDGRGEPGRGGSRCCCALGAVVLILMIAGGLIFTTSL